MSSPKVFPLIMTLSFTRLCKVDTAESFWYPLVQGGEPELYIVGDMSGFPPCIHWPQHVLNSVFKDLKQCCLITTYKGKLSVASQKTFRSFHEMVHNDLI